MEINLKVDYTCSSNVRDRAEFVFWLIDKFNVDIATDGEEHCQVARRKFGLGSSNWIL